MSISIFVPSKRGHYNDYALFVKAILSSSADVFIIKTIAGKLRNILSKKKVVFLDIDGKDLLWVLIRCFFSRKSYAVSVSVETLLGKKPSFKIWDGKKRISTQFYLRYRLLRWLKKSGRLKLISIHKGTRFEAMLTDVASFVTYDFQYYDLPYLSVSYERPIEFAPEMKSEKPIVLVFNTTSSSKKNLEELKRWIEESLNYQFIIVGNADFLNNAKKNNILVQISRYVSNEELLFLMKYCDVIYCYYANERPSGFMGRAMQLDKKVIVKKNSYLASIPYKKSIIAQCLSDDAVFYKLDHSLSIDFDESNFVKKAILE